MARAPAKRAIKQDRAVKTRQDILNSAITLFARRGILATTMSELARAIHMTPGTTAFVGQLGSAYARAGEHEKARAILSDLLALSEKEYVAEVHLAYVYAGLGEYDAAIDWLERAFEHRSASIYGINGSYLFSPMREHPRFQALLRKMNL